MRVSQYRVKGERPRVSLAWIFYFTVLSFYTPVLWNYYQSWAGMINSYSRWIWYTVAIWQLGLAVCWGYLNAWIVKGFSRKWQKAVGVALATGVACVSVFSLYLLHNFGESMNDGIMANVLATDRGEALELIFNSNFVRMLLPPIGILLACGAIAYVIRRCVSVPIPRGYGKVIGVAILILLSGLQLLHYYTFTRKKDEERAPLLRYWMMSEPEKYVWSIVRMEWGQRRFRELLGQKKAVQVESYRSEDLPGNLVIIVGESQRKEYMQLYGYPVSTTPALDSLARRGELVVYSQCVAPRFCTRESVPESLTAHSLDSTTREWYLSPSLADILHRVGYRVHWLSAQHPFGKENWSIATVALSSDSVAFLEQLTGFNLSRRYYDGDLLPYLSAGDTANRHCQIIHLMGQHPDYATHYPPTFGKFSEKDIPFQDGRAERTVIAHYANATLYGDWVVSQIIRHYSAQDALVVYFADHAQALYDDRAHPNVMGHSKEAVGLRVPFFVYASEEYKRRHPEQYAVIEGAKDRLFTNDIFSQSICQLIGIRSPILNPQENLWDTLYDTTRPRQVYGNIYRGIDTIDALPSYKAWLKSRVE